MTGMHKNTASIRGLIFGLLLTIAVLFLGTGNASALIGIKEGDIPKQIILDDINGKTVDVSKLFGKKPVIIVFWELTTDKSFLNYSLDELRFLNEFYEKYHAGKDLEIFGIFTPEEEKNITAKETAALENLIKMNRIKFPVLIDSGFEIFREYGVIALPSTVMIDKSGKIMFIYPSFPLAAQPVLSGKIEELIGIIKVKPKKEAMIMSGPDSRSARLYRYSLQMYKKGLTEQALSPLKKSMEMNPDSTWSHNLMGILLWKRGEIEGSINEFRRSIELNEKNTSAYFNYGFLLFENDKLDEAEQYLKTAVTLSNTMAEAHYTLGLLYRKKGMEIDALNEFRESLALFEERELNTKIYDSSTFHRVSTLYALSELYSKRKEDRKALEMLQKAVKITLGLDRRQDTEKIHRSEDLMIYEQR